jgi:hypothetical protein
MSRPTLGILHPGRMGTAVAAASRPQVSQVLWAEAGRSRATTKRAEWADFVAVPTVADVVRRCAVLVSLCPPHAAEAVADEVAAAGGAGLYLEANAIAPATVQRLADRLGPERVVDGALIGPPPWQAATTVLHVSGPRADEIAALFTGGPLQVAVSGPAIGQASAIKACFALQSKALPTLWAALAAAAEAYGVGGPVRAELARDGIDLDARLQELAGRASAKAWRWAGEMTEAADAFAAVDLPDGASRAAAQIYGRVAEVVGRDEPAEPADWIAALLGHGPDRR